MRRKLKIESFYSPFTECTVLNKAEYTIKGQMQSRETLRKNYSWRKEEIKMKRMMKNKPTG